MKKDVQKNTIARVVNVDDSNLEDISSSLNALIEELYNSRVEALYDLDEYTNQIRIINADLIERGQANDQTMSKEEEDAFMQKLDNLSYDAKRELWRRVISGPLFANVSYPAFSNGITKRSFSDSQCSELRKEMELLGYSALVNEYGERKK